MLTDFRAMGSVLAVVDQDRGLWPSCLRVCPQGMSSLCSWPGQDPPGHDPHEGWPWLHTLYFAASALVTQKPPQSLLFQTAAVKMYIFHGKEGCYWLFVITL